MQVTFINLTPHTVNLPTLGLAFQPSGAVARVDVALKPVAQISKIPFVKGKIGDVQGLPAQKANTIFIVSAMVRAALPQRKDLVSPSGLVRDTNGAVIGCSAFEIN